MAKRKKYQKLEEPTVTAEKRPTVSLVRCSLCNHILSAGESPNDHLDKAHPDIFKVETFFVDRDVKL